MRTKWASFLKELIGVTRVEAPPQVVSVEPGEVPADMEVIPEGLREKPLTGPNLEKAAREAATTGEILSVRVTQVVGAEIMVLLGSSALGAHLYGVMPSSEFDEKMYAGYEGTVGEMVDVVVTGYDRARGVALVSRRQAVALKRPALLKRLKVGVMLPGVVRSIQPFGAFLDLGGLHVILPVNEIRHDFVKHPGDVLSKGQVLRVKVITFDPITTKTRVSLKATIDPWEVAGSLYSRGAIVLGEISGIQGPHVWIRPQPYHGVEILCPALPYRNYTNGEPVRVKLSLVDPLGQRLRGRVIGGVPYHTARSVSVTRS